jgi:hypothetical protein
MLGAHDGMAEQPHVVPPRAATPHADHRWLVGTLLLVIAVSAIVGVVVATAMGQTTAAIIVGLVAAAFFTRVAC